jgi:HlyD family secretion protein
VLLALIGAGGYAALHLWVLRPDPVEVRVQVIDAGIVERMVTNTRAASVRARLRSLVTPDAAGRVTEIRFREGARVAAGQAVIQLDDRSARAILLLVQRELESAEALEAQAEARLADARRELERMERLFAEGNLSQNEIDQARTRVTLEQTALRSAAARVEQQRARLASAELDRDKLTVTAPFAGVITDLHTEVGEWAVPGAPLFELVSTDELYVLAEIDEVDSAELGVGLRVRVRLDAFQDVELHGRIVRVAQDVSERLEQNRTVEVEVELTGVAEGTRLLPGMSADIEVVLDRTPADVTRVPTLALLEGHRVLVARGGFAREIEIDPGLGNWEFTEVKRGLSPGDRVIVSLDKEEVKDGVEIVIEGDGPTP